MRILLVNYHYFVQGGPDRYFFNVKAALEKRGHRVVPFAFDYDRTLDTPYRKYFPQPITGRGACLLRDIKLSAFSKLRTTCRMFHNGRVNKKFREIVRAERPDMVFSIYLSSSLLPNILAIAKKEFGLPVVYRLSDYHMFCASYLFCRGGRVCTECLDRPWSAVRHRCVHQSLPASLIRLLQMRYVKLRGWYDHVDAFICPSKLMAQHLADSGCDLAKIHQVPTFAGDTGPTEPEEPSSGPYGLYFGNIIPEKGIDILIRAYARIEEPSFSLKLIGYCDPAYRSRLFSMLDDSHKNRVEITGPEYGDGLVDAIRRSLFVVHPALCLENMPNSILEAMSAGKPVLASNLGSLPEIVKDGVNGRLFTPGDPADLARILVATAGDPKALAEMGRAARRSYERLFTEESHAGALDKVLCSVVSRRRIAK